MDAKLFSDFIWVPAAVLVLFPIKSPSIFTLITEIVLLLTVTRHSTSDKSTEKVQGRTE